MFTQVKNKKYMKTCKYISITILAAVLTCLIAFQARADIMPRPTNANELVYDEAHVIDSANFIVISDSLKNLYTYNKSQVVVITVNSLDGMLIEDYCQKVFDSWGIGDKETNNGVLIVIKPKTDDSPEGKGQVRIQTGYGAEGALPDLLCKRLQTDSMIPAFKENNYGLAVRKAVSAIVPIMKGEYPKDCAAFLKEQKEKEESDARIAVIVYAIVYLLIFGSVWFYYFMPNKKDWYPLKSSPLAAAALLASGRSRSSSWSSSGSSSRSSSSWSSSSSSSSSSSWDWGGGSSGGGGASSSW